MKQCTAINAKCSNSKYKKIGLFAKVYQQKGINNIETNVKDTSEEETKVYQAETTQKKQFYETIFYQ